MDFTYILHGYGFMAYMDYMHLAVLSEKVHQT